MDSPLIYVTLKIIKHSFIHSLVDVYSQESAPLSATLLADWREMTKEIDAGDLEAAVLDFEHAPTKINLCDINSMLPHS